MGSEVARTAEDCLQACQKNLECNWFGFFKSERDCTMTSSCDILDTSCGEDCVYGSRECELESEQGKSFIICSQRGDLKI